MNAGRTAAQHLDYASPSVAPAGRLYFRTMLGLFAVGGIIANLALIALTAQRLHQAQWVYHDLMQNPRAYGREIDPEVIESLRDLLVIRAAFVALVISSALGLLLAVSLLVAAVLLDRKEASARQRLTWYRRWKPAGIVLTVVTLFWADSANHNYWVAAT